MDNKKMSFAGLAWGKKKILEDVAASVLIRKEERPGVRTKGRTTAFSQSRSACQAS